MNSLCLELEDRSFLTPSAPMGGVLLPDSGHGLVMGRIVAEESAIEEAARKIVGAKNPTVFPGPLVLWKSTPDSVRMAEAVSRLARAGGMKVIPMADYRPKYPKINPEEEINPSHPNLTIWHNKIDVCLFVGVHCHYSNIALKIIRGGSSCYTIALCSYAGDDEANLTVRDLSAPKILEIGRIIRKMKTNSMRG